LTISELPTEGAPAFAATNTAMIEGADPRDDAERLRTV
jgi:hypothetical protein